MDEEQLLQQIEELVTENSEASAEIGRLGKENATLREVGRGLHWMARRYADGRMTYAPITVNRHTRTLLGMGVDLVKDEGTYFARDGMGRAYDDLTDEEVTEVDVGERTEHEAADQIRCLMEEDERFLRVSGATAFRRADPKRGWTDAGYFSFERGGRLYFVTVEAAED